MWGTLRIKNIEKGSGIYIHYTTKDLKEYYI